MRADAIEAIYMLGGLAVVIVIWFASGVWATNSTV
jgi:hypothetical protein